VLLAKASATLQRLAGGRHEFGIGAGWMQSDYDEAGLPFDSAGTRIARLDEALQIIRSMWTEERTRFEGKHYQIRDIARAVDLGDLAPPRVLIGGGGPKVLALAGRHADIVGINPKVHEGRVTGSTAADCAPERVLEKIRWVREAAEAAGRDPDSLEFNALTFVVGITDDPKPLREQLAKNSGMTSEQIADCPLFLTGSPNEIRERLELRREQTGIHYIVIQGDDPKRLEQFAEAIVAPLAGR
jgi:probable F420-dependent oxidoreductase